VLCAITHGLMWSVSAPIGARLVPVTHAGRATTAVYVGTSLALVAGNPLRAWLLAAFGIAGLVSMGVMARPLDRRPHASAVSCLAARATAFAVLTSLAFDRGAGLALMIGASTALG
jgi:predicted MFS family arabinose efflux permease